MRIDSGEFTAESVSDGHPDKICDQISDALLDAYLDQDAQARVAIECAIKDHHIFVLGEATSAANVDVRSVICDVLARIGHTDGRWGLDPARLVITTGLSRQSMEIRDAVNGTEIGAGDQGSVYGYACSDTPELMPAAISLAHALMRQHRTVRHSESGAMLGPDAKAQVTVRYADGRVACVSKLVLSTQHAEDVPLSEVRNQVQRLIIEPVLHQAGLGVDDLLINPGGAFTIGGPVADAGLTGRKIIVDTYGGQCRHGGGAFSGKDPTKVDRSGAYGARQLAKFIVAEGISPVCEVRACYAIGRPEPMAIGYDTFGGPDGATVAAALDARNVNPAHLMTPSSLIKRLGLRHPIYAQFAAFGHFGRSHAPWESPLI